MDEPTHCSKCDAKLEPPRVHGGPPSFGRRVEGGWYTMPGSKDPLCPDCAEAAVYIRRQSRETLRLQIARGTDEEVWPAFEELMRRNMEEGS